MLPHFHHYFHLLSDPNIYALKECSTSYMINTQINILIIIILQPPLIAIDLFALNFSSKVYI